MGRTQRSEFRTREGHSDYYFDEVDLVCSECGMHSLNDPCDECYETIKEDVDRLRSELGGPITEST